MCMVSAPVDTKTYLRNSPKCMQVHVQYPYITKPLDMYNSLIEPQLTLCTHKGVV